jgi:hypothetical protein
MDSQAVIWSHVIRLSHSESFHNVNVYLITIRKFCVDGLQKPTILRVYSEQSLSEANVRYQEMSWLQVLKKR